MTKAQLSLCKDCTNSDLAGLRQTIEAAGLSNEIAVYETPCLGPCSTPSVLALNGDGRAGYVFAGVDLRRDAHDIASTCALYLGSDAGWIEDARPCGRLRHLLVARMPA